MNKKIKGGAIGLGGAVLVVALTAAGCNSDNFKDLKGVQNKHPDYIVNVENEDKQPNIAFLCIHGTPVLTSTRSSAAAVRIITTPSTVKFCESKIGDGGD